MRTKAEREKARGLVDKWTPPPGMPNLEFYRAAREHWLKAEAELVAVRARLAAANERLEIEMVEADRLKAEIEAKRWEYDRLKAENERLREAYVLLKDLWVTRGHGGNVPLRPEHSPYHKEADKLVQWLKLDAALETQG